MTTQLDHQRTVEEIQNALTEVSVPFDLLQDVVVDYQTACEEANERLRECQDLLRRGLRGEAIQGCDVAPNLLELVAVLDFPERALWCDALRQVGRTVPPELRIDAAAELNAAYAQEQPLTAMMGRHRLLALARAPLPQRIAVLRRIAQSDPANAVWTDDLTIFEKRRHEQLQGEAEAAQRIGDLHQLDQLEAELRETEWLVPPQTALVQWTVAAATRLRAERARQELQVIEPELTAAHSEFDVERGRALRARWQACANLLDNLEDDDPLVARVAPALEWLREQDQREQAEADYARAAAELERALDDDAPREAIDRRYHDLARCERGVPEVLQRRFQERVANLDLAAARRNKLWVVGIAAGVIAVASLTWFGLQHQFREREAAQTVATLTNLLDESKLDETRQYLKGLEGERTWLRERPEVVEQEARLDGLVSQERDRAAAFREAIDGVLAMGLDRPDGKLLDEARRLAKGNEEHEVLQVEHRVATLRRERQEERDRAFTERVDELRDRVRKLEAGQIAPGDEPLAAIERTEVDARELEQESNRVDPTLAAGATALRKKLAAIRDTERLRLDRDKLAREITATVGQRDRYGAKLAAYVKTFPEGKRSYDFLQVLDKERTVWEQLEKWDTFVGKVGKLDIAKITPAEAAAETAEAQVLLAVLAAAPQTAEVRRRLEFLPAIARRVADDGTRIEVPLADMFRLRTIADLTMVEDTDGKRYYTTDTPKRNSDIVTFKYLQNFKLATKSKLLKEDKLATDGIAAAPQSVVAKKVLDQLSRLSDTHWEAAFCHILFDVYDEPRMDPVLKAQLMGQVLAVARQGSVALERAFARHDMLINDANLDGTINWLDPDDADARRARNQAQELLDRLPDPRAAREAAAKEFTEAHRPHELDRYRWIGWLSQADDGRWRCSTEPLRDDVTGDLYVVHPNPNGSTIDFSKIGKLAAGQATLDDAPDALVEGRPVYALVAPAQKRPSGG